MSALRNVQITNTSAIYVDNSRITSRATKWGIHTVLADFNCDDADVVKECLARGFEHAVRMIDTEPYRARAEAIHQEPQP